jgi:solute:Na+ symporter, SSS family
VLGVGGWLSMVFFGPETYWPPELIGLMFSIAGMMIGSMLPSMLHEHHQPHKQT